MKRIVLAAMFCAVGIFQVAADRVALEDGRIWENVKIVSYRLSNGVPEFQIEPTAGSTADVTAGWHGGVTKAEFGESGGAKLLQSEAAQPVYSPIEATVSSIIQADLLMLATGHKVRLLGVDTPDTTDPNRPLEYFGKEAYLNTKKLTQGRRVRVEFGQHRMDNHGNLLGYVYVLPENTLLNLELVRTGHANAWFGEPLNSKRKEEFQKIEDEARSRRIGIWDTEKRRASVRNYQFVEQSSLATNLETTVQARPEGARSRGTYASRSSSSGRRRGRSITVDVEYQQGPAFVPGPFGFGMGNQTSLTVTPR